jgi:lysophospholipase L1-like esterase
MSLLTLLRVRAPRQSPGRALAAVLVAIAVAAGCGESRSSGYQSPREPRVGRDASGPESVPESVVMVGDSITVSSRAALEERFTAIGLEVVAIEAEEGRRMTVGTQNRTSPGSDVVEFIASVSSPDVWVIALGTNDIGQYDDGEQLRSRVAEVLRPIPDDALVLWVDTWYRDRLAETVSMNEAIRSVVESRPGATVVDWFTAAQADGVIVGDGVHLTADVGVDRFADVVSGAVFDLLP